MWIAVGQRTATRAIEECCEVVAVNYYSPAVWIVIGVAYGYVSGEVLGAPSVGAGFGVSVGLVGWILWEQEFASDTYPETPPQRTLDEFEDGGKS
jgi:hypothetical protein